MVDEPNKDDPGYYESDLPDYPGFVCFPHPFMYHHFKVWWKAAVENLKGKTQADFDSSVAEWHGAKRLLLDFGDWQIKGVASGDAEADSLPMEVITFVCECADDYVFPLLPPKVKRLLSTSF